MLWRIAAFAALGGFLFGYDLGVMGGALLGISDEFATSEWADGVIVGAAKFGACFGAFLGGALMLHYGRRVAISIDSLLFMAGPLVMASARGVTSLAIGRGIVGLAIGVSAVVVPAYLGEVAPPNSRGTMVQLYEVLLCVGMLMAMVVDWLLSALPGAWRWMLAVPFVPALIMSAALFVVPESPRWLVVSGRLDEALAVLHRILASASPNGSQTSVEEAEQELMELWSGVEKDKAAVEQRLRNVNHARHQRGNKSMGIRKHSWQSVSSTDPGTSQSLERSNFPSLRRTPIQLGPSSDRTPPLLSLLRPADGPVAAAPQSALPGPSMRRSASPSPAVSVSSFSKQSFPTADKSLQNQGASERQPLIDHPIFPPAAQGSSHPQGAPIMTHAVGGHPNSSKGMRSSASGPCLRSMLPPASPSSTVGDRKNQVMSGGLPSSHGTSSTTELLRNPVSQPQNGQSADGVGSSNASERHAPNGFCGERGRHTIVSSSSSKKSQRKPRWKNYNEDSDSGSGSEASPQQSQKASGDHMRPLAKHQGGDKLQADSGLNSRGEWSEGGGMGFHLSLEQQASRALTVRTDCDSSPSSLPSPVIWFDDEGTPQFHRALKLVPVGLPPIRTQSEDVEARGRACAFQKPSKRQGAAAPPRISKAVRHDNSMMGGEPQPVPTLEHPSFASALAAMVGDIGCVAGGDESAAFWIAIWLAFFNQACASTAIINYAPQLLHKAGGLRNSDSILFSSFVSASKVVGVVTALILVDRVGRRPLLLVGSAVSTAAMTALAMSDAVHSAVLVVAAMSAFIVAFSASWAGVFWVLMSEMFSMSVKSPAIAAATAALFLTGAVTDFLFLALHRIFGGGTFLLYAAVSAAGGVFVYRHLPETRGKNLEEVQALMSSHKQPSRAQSSSTTQLQLTRLRPDIP